MALRELVWQQLLLQIYRQRPKQCYISSIHRKIKGSLTHLRAILRRMENNGLIEIIPAKNRRMLQLTNRGEKVAYALTTLNSELNARTTGHDGV